MSILIGFKAYHIPNAGESFRSLASTPMNLFSLIQAMGEGFWAFVMVEYSMELDKVEEIEKLLRKRKEW